MKELSPTTKIRHEDFMPNEEYNNQKYSTLLRVKQRHGLDDNYVFKDENSYFDVDELGSAILCWDEIPVEIRATALDIIECNLYYVHGSVSDIRKYISSLPNNLKECNINKWQEWDSINKRRVGRTLGNLRKIDRKIKFIENTEVSNKNVSDIYDGTILVIGYLKDQSVFKENTVVEMNTNISSIKEELNSQGIYDEFSIKKKILEEQQREKHLRRMGNYL